MHSLVSLRGFRLAAPSSCSAAVSSCGGTLRGVVCLPLYLWPWSTLSRRQSGQGFKITVLQFVICLRGIASGCVSGVSPAAGFEADGDIAKVRFIRAARKAEIPWYHDNATPVEAMEAAAWVAAHTPEEEVEHRNRVMAWIRGLAAAFRSQGALVLASDVI